MTHNETIRVCPVRQHHNQLRTKSHQPEEMRVRLPDVPGYRTRLTEVEGGVATITPTA